MLRKYYRQIFNEQSMIYIKSRAFLALQWVETLPPDDT